MSGLPSLPTLDLSKQKKSFTEISKEDNTNNQINKNKEVDNTTSLNNNPNKTKKQKRKMGNHQPLSKEETEELIALNMKRVQKGTSEEADIINSEVLMRAPIDFFIRYQKIVKEVTSWIQNETSKIDGESTVIKSIKDNPTDTTQREKAFSIINKHFFEYDKNPTVHEYNIQYKRDLDKAIILSLVIHEICGLGPLEPLFRDFNLKELVCNGPHDIQVEEKGQMKKVKACRFRDKEHLEELITRLYGSVNKSINSTSPMERARLHDNSRVFAVDKSVAPGGPSLNIRRHTSDWVSPDDLINFGSISKEAMEWLGSHINSELNFIVAGGTATGKSLALDTLIPTPDGFKKMGDLNLGDKVFDTNGNVTTVTNIFDQEPRTMYEVKFKDSQSVICDLEHNWVVYKKGSFRKPLTMTTQELLNTDFKNYFIALTNKPVEYNKGTQKVSDFILLSELEYLADGLNNKLELLNEYEFSSSEVRIELLAYLSNDFDLEKLNQKAPVLKRILRSLGFYDFIDFKKSVLLNELTSRGFEEIISITNLETKKPMRCITVDSESHTYLFGQDYLTTHNTTLLGALTGFYRNDARLLTVERNIELRPAPGKLWGTPMEVIPPKPGTKSLGIDMRTLVEATTQMRPDGIILGETTGEEAWDVTQALNSGHFGATTVHANSPEDTVQRMVALISQADVIKGEALLAMLSASFDIIVVTTRFPQDGSRKITSISELDTKVTLNDANQPSLKVKPIWIFEPDEFSGTPNSIVKGKWIKVGELSDERKKKNELAQKMGFDENDPTKNKIKPMEILRNLYKEN